MEPSRIWRREATFLAASVCFVAITVGCAAKRPQPVAIDPDVAARTFDAAWSIIHETHFDPTFNGVDWLALRDELRPRAVAATTVDDLRAVIREMLERLDQSHFALIPRQAVDDDPRFARGGDRPIGGDGQPGLLLREIDGAFVVWRVEPGSSAERSGVEPGWVLKEIEGRKVDEWIDRFGELAEGSEGRWLVLEALLAVLAGDPGSQVSVGFDDRTSRPVRLELERQPPAGQRVQLGNLPPLFATLEAETVSREKLSIEAGLIRMNVWMGPLAVPFAEAVDRFRGLDGIVIDLRGNPGGLGGMVMGLAGHFLDEQVSLGTMRMREQKLEFVANPQRVSPAGLRVRPYAGPVAILIDEMSASTSEVFAGGMQAVGRARIFGRRSAGMALPALMERLPNQDVLYHAVADFTTPAGAPIEKLGVTPDVGVPLMRDDLLAGRDADLERALGWIAEARSAAGAGHAKR